MRSLLKQSALWVALVHAGCSAQPDDIFYIQGQILDEFGAPVAQAPLTVNRTADPRPSGVPCGRMGFFSRVVSGADGHWTHSLIRQETLAPDGQPACFQVLFSSGQGRGFAEAAFIFPSTDVRLPPLRLWNWNLSVEPDENGARIRFHPIDVPSPDDSLRVYPVQHWLEIRAAGQTMWHSKVDGDTWVIGSEILEDFGPSQAEIVAEHDVVRIGVSGLIPDAVYTLRDHAPEIELPFTATRPVSRGADCGVALDTIAPCPLTDGALSVWSLPTSTKELVVRFQNSVTIRRVVLRNPTFSGAASRMLIEGTADAAGPWTLLGELSLPLPLETRVEPTFIPPVYVSGPLELTTEPVTWVRIRASDGAENPVAIRTIREVSFFE